MTSRDQRERLHVEIPYEVKAAMEDSDEPMWKIVAEGARMYLGLGDDTESAIEERLHELEKQRDDHADAVEEHREQVERIDEQIDELREKLEELREDQESYRQQLRDILEEMAAADGKNVRAWTEEIRDAAREEFGRATDDTRQRVIDDLRELATEEDYAIPSERFRATSVTGEVDRSVADGGAPHFSALEGGDADGDDE